MFLNFNLDSCFGAGFPTQQTCDALNGGSSNMINSASGNQQSGSMMNSGSEMNSNNSSTLISFSAILLIISLVLSLLF